MVSKSELEALRQEALARHRSAAKKVSRLKTQKGVDLAGTGLDPRRDTAKIKAYNSTQLKAYVASLDKFVSRETQYVADAKGRPIRGDLWNQYKRLEKSYNKRVNQNFSAVENELLPTAYDAKGKLVNPGNTIGRRMKTSTPDKRSSRGVSVNAPYDPPVRIPGGVQSEKALRALIRDMKKRVQTDHETKQVRKAKNIFGQFANTINDKDLTKAVKSLTPGQFRVLWNYTTFATDTSLDYEEAKKMLSPDEKATNDVFQDNLQSAKDLAAWASKLKV